METRFNNAPEDNIDISELKPKVRWYKFSPDEVNEKYSILLLRYLQHLFLDVLATTENALTECYNLLQVHSLHLFLNPHLNVRTRTKTVFMLNFQMTFRLLVMIVKVHLIFGNNRIFLIMMKFMMSIGLNPENTDNTCANSLIKLK